MFWSNWPEGHRRADAEPYVADYLYQVLTRGETEAPVRAIDLTCPAEQSKQSGCRQELYASLGIRYQFSGVFLRSAGSASMIVAVRGDREGPFVEPAFATLLPLMPHFRRAVLIHNELWSSRAQLAAATVFLDRYPHPILLTDASGRIIHANSAARRTASLQDGLAITSGQLSPVFPEDQTGFVKALEQVTARGGPLFRRVEVRRRSHQTPYLLLLMAAPRTGVGSSESPECAVSVLIFDRDARPELDHAILGEIFHLTPAEARVTGKLGCGWSATEIAEEMDISLETVRTHIRRVLSKTGTARQGELIALILRTALFRNI
ncbi:MAG TPA: LuxR C-terminal-related transcriptional regulator [Bryobacteraceae bacterium]|nr:LuxR C-terminal-related transcriptional regulator [Bryobacteraceae bacterium]